MTNRERENATLSFQKPGDRGSIEETFYPWTLTVDRFSKEGLPSDISENVFNHKPQYADLERYLGVAWAHGVYDYERHLGFDPVRRVCFTLPFRRFDEKVIEDTPEYTINSDLTGRRMKYHKESGLIEVHREVISCEDDWNKLKEHGSRELEQ